MWRRFWWQRNLQPHRREGLDWVWSWATGLTTKLWTGGLTALTFGAAWSFRDGGSFHLNGDYLVHHDLTQEARKAVSGAYIAGTPMVYYGVGARLRDEAEDKIGVRLPLGFNSHSRPVYGNHRPALVVAAVRANAVRLLGQVALRTLGARRYLQSVIRAPLGAARTGLSFLGKCHGSLPRGHGAGAPRRFGSCGHQS